MAKEGNVLVEGTRLIFRNFSGKAGKYNAEGKRSVGVILPPDLAEKMLADDWNVKYLNPTDEEKEQGIEQGPPMITAKVDYTKGRPPKITLVTERDGVMHRTILDEDTVAMLDNADIVNVDVILNPYPYKMDTGKSGIAAYLQTMFVTIEEDPLEQKYAQLSGQ